MALEIWHNPRCSKSCRTLQLIEESGTEHKVRDYQENPPTVPELDDVLLSLDMEPHELVRMGERVAIELGITESNLSRDEWLRLLVDNPILIQRPVVIDDDGRAIVGRPPERVQALL